MNLVENPVEHNKNIEESDESSLVDKGGYHQLVRRSIYLSHTHLDSAYVISVVSQFVHSPWESPMKAVYRILRDLKSSPRKALLFARHDRLKVELVQMQIGLG